ncbi:PRC-barrel domain-containing protein [Caldicellulosiruptoraceae bacterium PP1]
MYKSSDLREKDVISIHDGKKIGRVCDLEVDLTNGKVEAIVVPAPFSMGSIFSKDKDYIIPWEKIKKIGEDVILVEM